MIYTTTYSSPIGLLTLASEGKNLVGLWVEGQKYFARTIGKMREEKNNLEVFEMTKNWLDNYFAKKQVDIFSLPLAPDGSDFRKAVWDILCKIPYGETTTYGAIAKKMAAALGRKSMSSQAVGGAVGHNPITIIIPCHRVIGSNGNLIGFASGLENKIKLLKLEGVDIKKN